MTTRPSVDAGDLRVAIKQFTGYVPREPEEATLETNISDGENMALELPVGNTAQTRLTTRLGYTKKNIAPFSIDKVQGIKIWKPFGDTEFRCAVVSAGKFYEATFINKGDPLTFIERTGATFNKLNDINMVQFENELYIVDGENRIRLWNKTTFTDVTLGLVGFDDPRPSLIMVHANRIWINSTLDSQKNQVWWSVLNNGKDFRASPGAGQDGGSQTFRGFPDETNPISGMGVYTSAVTIHQAGRIYLFVTTGSPYNVSGEVTWTIKELTIEEGSFNNGSIADLGEKIVYLTGKGVHEMSGIQALQTIETSTYDQINAKPISYDVEPKLFSLQWDDAVAVYFKFYYILVLKGESSTHNDIALVYDSRRGVWYTPWTNYNFSCFHVARIGNEDVCFAGSSIDGTVYTLFTSVTDAGDDIESWFVTRAFDYKYPVNTKSYRKGYIIPITTQNRGVYASYSVDYAPFTEFVHEYKGTSIGAQPLGQFLLGTTRLGSGITKKKRGWFSVGRRGNTCRLKISNNNSNNTGGKKPFAIELVFLRGYLEDEDQRDYM